MARDRRRSQPGAGQQPLFATTTPEVVPPAPAKAPADAPAVQVEQAGAATLIDLPGAAALRTLRAGLGANQVQILPPDPPAPAPPVAPMVPTPAALTTAKGPLRYGRWRLNGPTWELHAALAALRRDTLTGRDLRRHLAELDAQPPAPAPRQARPQDRARPAQAGGEAGSARG